MMDSYASNLRSYSAQDMGSASALLYGFDIQDEESREFLTSLFAAGQVPEDELKEIIRMSLLRGKEEWDMIFACAGAIRDRSIRNNQTGPGLAPYLAHVLSGQASSGGITGAGKEEDKKKPPRKRREPKKKTSIFWEDDGQVGKSDGAVHSTTPKRERHRDSAKKTLVEGLDGPVDDDPVLPAQQASVSLDDPSSLLEETLEEAGITPTDGNAPCSGSPPLPFLRHYHSPTYQSPTLKRKRTFKSPFFTPSPAQRKARPPRGTISSLPFPPLSAPRFGLVQESLSHDPFRLLVAVTFLIRTTGKAAIPVFHTVMDRFPTPEAFVAAHMEAEVVPMIAHLGLPAVRCAAIGKYARIWMEEPPRPGMKFVVRGYPRQATCQADGGEEAEQDAEEGEGTETKDEVGPESNQPQPEEEASLDSTPATPKTPEPKRRRRQSKLNSSEWEIGHLTQGRYAIDSWRIFCRDIFLGKSDNWMGLPGMTAVAGDGPEPEWMRVLPEDKELRACLRWMWMREGFEWNPVSGQKSPLREEMRLAVEHGRVKYDERGDLVILDGSLDIDQTG